MPADRTPRMTNRVRKSVAKTDLSLPAAPVIDAAGGTEGEAFSRQKTHRHRGAIRTGKWTLRDRERTTAAQRSAIKDEP